MATTMLAGRYKIRHKLGSGGMATVYEAHDDLLDRAVAIKLLRNEALAERTARQRFAGEARAAASLTHPHAVAVYDVNSGDEQPFIVMELVRGRTLQDVIDDEGPMDEARVVAVGSQILAALHAAHRRGLVHRDVKPANILLPDGVVPTRPEELPGVKLADFGIAKATADATAGLTMVGQVIGTPKYLSPEQVKGERATPQSDLYAAGVVLYEMLAGRPPFEQDSAVGLALAHREDEPPPLTDLRPDVNRNLAAVVHRALAKDPTTRPADANAMRDALIAAAGGASGTQLLDSAAASTQVVPPAGPFEPTAAATTAAATAAARPPGGRSGRLAWWLVALALIAIIALLAVQWLANRAEPETDPNDQEAPAGQDQGEPDGGGAGGADEQQPDQQQPEDEQPGDGQDEPGQDEPGQNDPGQNDPGQEDPEDPPADNESAPAEAPPAAEPSAPASE